MAYSCLLYTSDAAEESTRVHFRKRSRLQHQTTQNRHASRTTHPSRRHR